MSEKEQARFVQSIQILSKKVDGEGFKKAKFLISTCFRNSWSEDTKEKSEVVEGVIFGDYGMHLTDKQHAKITHLPTGASIIAVNARVKTVGRRKAIARAMMKQFPSDIPGGIVREEERVTTISGKEERYTVLVAKKEYARLMSQIIAKELLYTGQCTRY
jgi:hypothetical protein